MEPNMSHATPAAIPPGLARHFVRRRATVAARQITSQAEAEQARAHPHGDTPAVGDWIIEGAGKRWIVERDAFAALYEPA